MRREVEHRIAAVAAAQHGVVSRPQLLGLGLSEAAIGRRLKAGRLRALHRGVYLVGPIETGRSPVMAAVLAGGPGALASHTSVLPLWGMTRAGFAGPVHVSVPGSGRSRRPGIRFHRVGLADDERAVVDRIPTTSPARTLVDIAGMLGSREVELAVALAERNGLVGGDELATLPERYAGRPGMAMLRTLIQDRMGPDLTRSQAEREALDMIREGGLPRPHTNVRVGPYELDLFWPEDGVAIEIDGRAYHSSRARFEGDRQKDAWLRTRGIEVVRLTWRQLTTEAKRTAVQVGQILALAQARREAVRRDGLSRLEGAMQGRRSGG